MPQRLHHVGVQIRPHSCHQIRQHTLRQRHLERILPKRRIAKAAWKILRHTHHAHSLTSLVKEHLVGQRRPAVAPRQMAADDEIAIAPRAPVQHLLSKLEKTRHRIRMDPAAVHQRIWEAHLAPGQRHKAAVCGKCAQRPLRHIHLPHAQRRLIKRRLQASVRQLQLLPLLS